MRPGGGARRRALIAGATALALAPAVACTAGPAPAAAPAIDAGDERLVAGYFAADNAAAAQGSAAQQQFLRRTQHPDFASSACELDGMALVIRPTLSTLRLDPGWTPPGSAAHPRGHVYFVAVEVAVQRDGITVGNQIGYQHVVTLDHRAYAFAPCATT